MAGESVRDTLEATVKGLAGTDTGQPAAAAQPSEAVPGADGAEAQAAPAVQDPSRDASTDANGQPRDEGGRFAPKDIKAEAPKTGDTPPAAEAAPPVSETAKPEGAEAPKEPIRVPPSLPAAVKAKFATLDPDVQQAFAHQEDSVQKAKAEWGKKGERLNRFDEIFAPRRDQLAMRGLDEFQAIKVLLAAQDLLDRNPAHGLTELARSYGVNLQQLAQQTSGQPAGQAGAQPGPAPAIDPAALQPVMQQLQTLQQQFGALTQQQEAEKSSEAQRQVSDFASKPENLYWEDVKQDVALLLQNGRASTLQDAYDMAIWASPTVRPLLLQAQSQEQQRQAQEKARASQAEAAARAKSQAASAAAGSVTGGPQGAVAASDRASTGNLRKDLEAAFAANTGV